MRAVGIKRAQHLVEVAQNSVGLEAGEATRMDMSEKHISKLINGVQLTPEVAVRLEVVLGVPAKFWNNLEAVNREKLINVKDENAMKRMKL